MQSSPTYLKLCNDLALKGCFTNIKGDRRVARGFADLGYEEFLLLNEKKLVSLYTGTITELPEAHKAFFITVPTIEDIIDQILGLGFTIEPLAFANQRTWSLSIKRDMIHIMVQDKEIGILFAKALFEVL